MAAHPPTPLKPFREEAKVAPVQCPACGGPIALRGFGGIEQVSCPHCGTELQADPGSALQILQYAQRARRSSAIPLHARGIIEGDEWEVLGIVWREAHVEGVTYPWQEFLLFNPYKGYRWLVFSMTDGHWSFGDALPGAPRRYSRSLLFKRQVYKHFQSSWAVTSYVEGEFPWQIHVGDRSHGHEYVRPPHSISVEENPSEGGHDVSFTALRWISPSEVWRAFRLPGAPPPLRGVGTLQPNPWKERTGLTWLSFVVMLGIWAVLSVIYVGSRSETLVFERERVGFEPIVDTVQIGEDGESTVLELELEGHGLSNSWAAAEVILVREGTEEALGFASVAVVDNWHGVSGGEHWSEGNRKRTQVIAGVPGGRYLLQVAPTGGTQGTETPPATIKLDIRLRQDVALLRYVLLPLGIIIGIPLLYLILGAAFEGRRWANSDHAP